MYAACLKFHTSTNMSADEIHALVGTRHSRGMHELSLVLSCHACCCRLLLDVVAAAAAAAIAAGSGGSEAHP